MRRSSEVWVTAVVLAATVIFTLVQLHPRLLLRDTTPTGGDTGAHVWGPAYLRDHLLPQTRISGWAGDWFAGFPVFQFYPLPPALLIVLLDFVLPYNVAFKLVTVLGVVSLPVAAWFFARSLKLDFPAPPLLAVATLPFLFDHSYSIYGGNVSSTLAGEFSFSIGLSLALVYLGTLSVTLRTGRYRARAGLLYALTALCHPIVVVYASTGTVMSWVVYSTRRQLLHNVALFISGCAVTAFWTLPFLLRAPYVTDMRYERLPLHGETVWKYLAPEHLGPWLAAAGAATAVGLLRGSRGYVYLSIMAVSSGLMFTWIPSIGLWNARLLPFYYFGVYMLAGAAGAEAVKSAAASLSVGGAGLRSAARMSGVLAALAVTVIYVALPLRVLPGGRREGDTYRWLTLSTTDANYAREWAKHNYRGYEGQTAYPEYAQMMSTMKRIGHKYGCGRAHWEYDKALGRYGTPMAMMLLPYWTNGCVASMEGLYFESSATSPFHFLTAAELSARPSNPVRGLPYPSLDVRRGVDHLVNLGVQYYLAITPAAVAAADLDARLTRVAQSGPWKVYLIRGVQMVTGLSYEPAVLREASARSVWDWISVAWYRRTSNEVPLASDGPNDWQRVRPGQPVIRRSVYPAKVSRVHLGDHHVSFEVDRLGQPVLVKVSYFPNWKVEGGHGPYRVTPNLMVVVPTEQHVRMQYEYTTAEVAGWFITVAGLTSLAMLARRTSRPA